MTTSPGTLRNKRILDFCWMDLYLSAHLLVYLSIYLSNISTFKPNDSLINTYVSIFLINTYQNVITNVPPNSLHWVFFKLSMSWLLLLNFFIYLLKIRTDCILYHQYHISPDIIVSDASMSSNSQSLFSFLVVLKMSFIAGLYKPGSN